MEFDLVVIGSGPAGQKAAINAAKQGCRVAIVEREPFVGGVCVNTGTIPSKAMREAVLHLTGYRQRCFYGSSYAVKEAITMSDLNYRTDQVIRTEIDVIRGDLVRNNVQLFTGHASFVDPHRVQIQGRDGRHEVAGRYILIAVGSKPFRPPDVPFTAGRIIDSDQILQLKTLPRSMLVVGGGVIGVEYACMMAAVGVSVTLVDKRTRLLEFVDTEIADALQYHMRDMGVRLRLGEEIAAVGLSDRGVEARLASGKRLRVETAMFASGRQGNTDDLNLPAAGLMPDDRGRVKVNEYYQTDVEHIFAAGDVVGFPALAATSMEQGRLATNYMLGRVWEERTSLFPLGIYTIPEISMVGRTEDELMKQGVPYETGSARYRETARGQLIGDLAGMLKLLFHPESRRLLGIHIIGEGATELIHIGQTAMAAQMPIDYFVSSVFNYPTLAECYRVAALEGINRVDKPETPDDGADARAEADLPAPEVAAAH